MNTELRLDFWKDKDSVFTTAFSQPVALPGAVVAKV